MKNEIQELKKLGLRIKSVRVLTGLNQEEFARECGFNHTSLRNWEFGRVSPRPRAISKLIDAFKCLGVFTCVEWIVNGSGEGPMFYGRKSVIDGESINAPIIGAFKKHMEEHSNKSIIITVRNDDMRPYFSIGDVIGAVLVSIHKIERWPNHERERLLSEPILSKCDKMEFEPHWLNFDGERWWARSQSNFSLKALSSDIIGVVAVRIRSQNLGLLNEVGL